jgi:hypothetical protein
MIKLFTLLVGLIIFSATYGQVHTTYLWHLQQPIYWPEQSQWDPSRYQTVWESHYLKSNGGNIYSDGLAHPLNDLEEIFGKDDRKAVYQWRTKDAVQSILSHPNAGAQVNYSGCLIENVNSLAQAGQWGYSNGWENNFVTARNWQTSGGFPRMDIVSFTFHHVLAPLVSERVLRKEIQMHRHIYNQTFGTSPDYSKGFWPAECSFSERIIKVLMEEGIEWSVVANSHLARTLADYPLNFGTAGCNIDPPNAADKVTTTGNNWWNGQIDGRGGTFAAPYSYQAHKAQYVDPETGQVYKITVVPMADLLSYKDGFSLMGTGDIDAHIAPFSNPARPSIVLLAHDGDNAWGGGYDYYINSVNQFTQAAANQGYTPNTIQQFLAGNPVPDDAVVKVEDGSWVNAANDWGHPQFINWIWPLYTPDYEFNPEGWTEDVRNWAVLTAAENFVIMAEDIAGTPPVGEIVSPGAGSSNAAKAWHHLLPGYTSGYMYYGVSLDMEVKPSLAANIAVDYAKLVINNNPGVDNTPPSVFIPQRYPYNPGGIGFGPNYGYQVHQNSSDFAVWTLAFDVSGLSNVVLKYRLDEDGVNPLDDHANNTYAGGPGVGSWQSVPMQSRLFPAGNVTNNPEIDFFIMPDYIAYHYWAEITGLSEVLVDYYVEATDTYGNTFKTPIQHVYVGEYTPGGSGQGSITWQPEQPDNNDIITIKITNATQGANLHWGVNGFNTPIEDYWPAGTFLINPAVETPFEGPNEDGELVLQIGPFNNPEQEVTSIGFVIHYDDDTWDNNNGQDFYIYFGGGTTQGITWSPTSPNENQSITITVNQAPTSGKLHWGVNNWNQPNAAYWPEGSFLFGGSGPAVQSPMNGPNANDQLTIQIGPFNNPAQQVNEVNFVISYDDGTWDNNNGLDYHITITPAPESGHLAGAVKNSATGLFIQGATVSASTGSTTFSALTTNETDPGINYTINNIPAGTYTVSAQIQGFEPQQTSDVIITANETTIANFDLQPIDFPLPPGWDFMFTPVSHNISVPENMAGLYGELPLNYGDYIGVFYVNNTGGFSCAGAIQWKWESTVLSAFGDDSFTQEKDGFNTGDILHWRVYRQSSGTDFPATAEYDPGFPQSDGLFFPNGLSRVLSIEAFPHITQTLQIPAGWSGISLFTIPLQKNVESIFEPYLDDFVIMSSATKYYYPDSGTNTIIEWDNKTGYQVKAMNPITLQIPGEIIIHPQISLEEGWNLIPVLTECGVDPDALLVQLPGIGIIKGIGNTEVFWPEYNINTIQTMNVGKAYWISTSEAGTFTFPECNGSMKNGFSENNIHLNIPWNEPVSTGSSHLIAFPADVLDASELMEGDIIGIFTYNNICAGIAQIESLSQNLVMMAFADDATTPQKDGLVNSETISMKLFRPSQSKEGIISAEFEIEKPQQDEFAANGVSAVKSLSISSFGISEVAERHIEIFPNPSKGKFIVVLSKSPGKVTIEIKDLQGQTFLKNESAHFSNEFMLDFSAQPEGVYLLQISGNDFSVVQKIMIIK